MGKEKKSKTEVIESQLSKEQANILKDREKFYQNFTQPALEDYYAATRSFELRDDFSSLDDLTDTLDLMFSDEPEQQELSRSLMRAGFDASTQQAAQEKLTGAQAVAKEGTYSAANLAAIQKANQNVARQNQNQMQEQQVRQSGISALLGQAPQATSAGSPVMSQTTTGPNPLIAAGAGALGAGLGALGNMGSSSPGNLNFDSPTDLAGGFDFSTGFAGSGGRGALNTTPNFTGQGMFR
jgi:hypothetical protein